MMLPVFGEVWATIALLKLDGTKVLAALKR